MKIITTTVNFVINEIKIIPVIIAVIILTGCNNAGEKKVEIETSDMPTTADIEFNCPKFPLHPPKASAFKVIPRNIFVKDTAKINMKTLIESRLLPALDSAGYEYSYYCFKDSGIAIVTRLEKINSDGTSKNNDERYLTENNATESWNPLDYLLSLIRAKPGYYRVNVFIISPYLITQSDKGITKDQADSIFAKGADRPYDEFLKYTFSDNYQCTVFIYQFVKPNAEDDPKQLTPSALSCQNHLEKSKIWSNLLKVK